MALTCTEVSDDDRCYGCWSVAFGKPCPTCDLPRCESCGETDDNLYEGLCRECEDFGAPSEAELRKWERSS